MAYTRRAIRRAAEDCAAAGADGADGGEAAAAAQRLSPAACNAPDGAPAQGPDEDVLQREASSEGVAGPSRDTSGPAACFSVSDDDTAKVQLGTANKVIHAVIVMQKAVCTLRKYAEAHRFADLHALTCWQECRQPPERLSHAVNAAAKNILQALYPLFSSLSPPCRRDAPVG